MRTNPNPPTTIDEYIAVFSPEVRAILEKVRHTIKKAAPKAVEKISYQLPTFVQDGNLVHFGAFKNHIGFYPPVRDEKVRREASVYAGEKGNLRFPLDEPIPYALITKIVKARVVENREAKEAKASRKSTRARTPLRADRSRSA